MIGFHRPVVLAYHGVGLADEDQDPRRLITPPGLLRTHVKMLLERGYRFMNATELLDATGGGRPPPLTAVLTFDDGWRNWITDALPVLEDLGVGATFYVCPGWWGARHPLVEGTEGALMTESEAGDLSDRGIDIGSHSMSHPDLRMLDDAALRQELFASKSAVEAVTGRSCRTFAYPYGLVDDRVKRAAHDAGYELAFAWLPGRWDPLAAPRLPAPPRHGARRLALKMLGVRAPGR